MNQDYRKKLEEQGLKRKADAKAVYVEVKTFSNAGVEYTKYKELVIPNK